MKTLMILISLVLVQACGTEDKSSPSDNSNSATSDSTTAVVAKKKAVVAPVVVKPVDTLTGTSWATACNQGSIYTASFLKGEETITAEVYSDAECQDLVNTSAPDILAYAIQGAKIQVGQGTANKWMSGAPSSNWAIKGDVLTLDNTVYNKVSQ